MESAHGGRGPISGGTSGYYGRVSVFGHREGPYVQEKSAKIALKSGSADVAVGRVDRLRLPGNPASAKTRARHSQP